MTAAQIRREASGYLLNHLGHYLRPGEPTFDTERQEWTVPIQSRALPEGDVVGQLVFDAAGNVVCATDRAEIRAAVERWQAAGHISQEEIAWAASAKRKPELTAEMIAAVVANDEGMRQACSDLILALAERREAEPCPEERKAEK